MFVVACRTGQFPEERLRTGFIQTELVEEDALARQYESSHLPVQLVSARSEQWIAGCET